MKILLLNYMNLFLKIQNKSRSVKMPSRKKIAIIGFGRFGQLMAKYLSEDFEVYVSSSRKIRNSIRKTGAIPASLKDACNKDFVIPAVPISQFESVLKSIGPLLRKNSLVVDVCSVKEYPVKLMKRILPKNVQILATHPLFGPDSAADSLKGRKIVICRVRINDKLYARIKNFLKKKGLSVLEMSPQKHDEEIAKSLLLTHFIGRGLIESKASSLEVATEGYNKLIEVLNNVKHDSWQLFEDMNRFNKYAKETRQNFIKSIEKINRKLK